MATRADLLSIAAIKRARRAQSLAAVRPEKGDKGEDGKPGSDGLTVKGEPGEDGIGVAAVDVEQEDASGFDLVVTLTDQSKSRHHVKLPRGKGGKDGKDGSFWVRGGIADNDAVNELKTGFPNRTDSTLSFDESTRTLTIAPVGSSFSTFTAGVERTYTTPQTIVIPNTTAPAFVYFDATTGGISQVASFDIALITTHVWIAAVYWNAVQGRAVLIGDERHGLVMDHATHGYLHSTRGAAWSDGLGITDIVADDSGALDTSAQLSVNDGAFYDEDIKHTILGVGGSLPIIWETTGDVWHIADPAAFPVLYSGRTGTGYTGASGRLAYNPGTSLIEVANGKFVLALIGATNDIRWPVFAVVGREEYTTITNARAAAYTEWRSLTGLPFTEWAPIGAVIFETSSAYANAVEARIRSTDEGGDYIDLRGELTLGASAPAAESVQREVFRIEDPVGVLPTVTYPAIAFQATSVPGQYRMHLLP